MRRDRALMSALEDPAPAGPAAAALPTLRLYSWEPWTVSLGNAQDPERAVDRDELARRRYGWVKRPTGGRAVLHANEITYCVAAPLTGPFAGDLAQTHRRIASALARFYDSLGLKPEFSRPASREELDPRLSAPCFLAPGMAELEIEGRKLAGSAQRRGRHAFLQHGSLPLDDSHLELAELLPLDAEGRWRVKESLARQAASLSEFLERLPAREQLLAKLADAFRTEFHLDWAPSGEFHD